MSDRMTSIRLPFQNGSGLADWGLKTPAEMIAQLREKAACDKAIAEQILAATDDQFRVETYIGRYVQRKCKVLQEGKK